jgi:hypothetical protein
MINDVLPVYGRLGEIRKLSIDESYNHTPRSFAYT